MSEISQDTYYVSWRSNPSEASVYSSETQTKTHTLSKQTSTVILAEIQQFVPHLCSVNLKGILNRHVYIWAFDLGLVFTNNPDPLKWHVSVNTRHTYSVVDEVHHDYTSDCPITNITKKVCYVCVCVCGTMEGRGHQGVWIGVWVAHVSLISRSMIKVIISPLLPRVNAGVHSLLLSLWCWIPSISELIWW